MTDYLHYTPKHKRNPTARQKRRKQKSLKPKQASNNLVQRGTSSFGTSEHGWEEFKCFQAPKRGDEFLDKITTDYLWENNRYSVCPRIRFNPQFEVPVLSLSFKDYYRTTHRDWRDFQNIKNELAGMESRAFEVYPEDSHLMDTANQFWLWCFPVGHSPKIGLFEPRIAFDTLQVKQSNQRPFRPQDNAKHPKIGKAWALMFCEDQLSRKWLMEHMLT